MTGPGLRGRATLGISLRRQPPAGVRARDEKLTPAPSVFTLQMDERFVRVVLPEEDPATFRREAEWLNISPVATVVAGPVATSTTRRSLTSWLPDVGWSET